MLHHLFVSIASDSWIEHWKLDGVRKIQADGFWTMSRVLFGIDVKGVEDEMQKTGICRCADFAVIAGVVHVAVRVCKSLYE